MPLLRSAQQPLLDAQPLRKPHQFSARQKPEGQRLSELKVRDRHTHAWLHGHREQPHTVAQGHHSTGHQWGEKGNLLEGSGSFSPKPHIALLPSGGQVSEHRHHKPVAVEAREPEVKAKSRNYFRLHDPISTK